MTKIILSILILFSTLAFANNDNDNNINCNNKSTISGKVIDISSGELLAGVKIKVKDTDIETFTNLDGNFNIDILPGTYTIIVSFISYHNSLIENIDIKSDEELNIHLSNND